MIPCPTAFPTVSAAPGITVRARRVDPHSTSAIIPGRMTRKGKSIFGTGRR
jgi:hypothetical protein